MITTIGAFREAKQFMPLDHQDSEQDVLSNSLLLWTIQEEGVLQALEKNGVLRADPARVDPGMLSAYAWMAARLAEKVPAPPGYRLPLWAWLRWDGRGRLQPDLRAGVTCRKGGVVCGLPLKFLPIGFSSAISMPGMRCSMACHSS